MSKITCFTDENRLHWYVQNVSVCTGTTRTHVSTFVRVVRYIWGRFERTHGDVFTGHTGFSRCHTTHTTPRTHHNDTHNTTQQHDHNTTQRQRYRDRDRERQRNKTGTEREEEMEEERQDMRREKIHF